MSQASSETLLGRVCKLLAGQPTTELPDSELVGRFAAGSGEAFAALVRRHGPMVLGVCRRVLRHQQDAEDAFQATFLALARKVEALRKHEAVGGWLHRIALRIAVRSSKNRLRLRHAVSGPTPEVATEADPLAAVSGREILCVLDEELERLPHRFRQPLLLYYLEGKTQEEAARHLGCPRGTLKARLERGRELLRARLTRRGVTLPAALLLTSLAPAASAVPLALTAAVTHAVLAREPAAVAAVALGRPAVVPSTSRGRGTFVLLLGLGILASGLSLLVARRPGHEQPKPTRAAAKDARPEPAGHDQYGDPLPPGAVARLGTVRFRHEGSARALTFSPDGRILAGMTNSGVILWEAATGREVRRITADCSFPVLAFTPDGKSLVVREKRPSPSGNLLFHAVDTGKVVRTLPLPSEKLLIAPHTVRFSPDGKRLALSGLTDKALVLDLKSGKLLHVLGGQQMRFTRLAFSPNGRTLALGTGNGSIQLWDVLSGRLLRSIDGHGSQPVSSVAFSHDGKTLASGSNSRIVLSEADSGKETGKMEAPMAWVEGLEFTPESKSLVSASRDGKVRIWDRVSRKARHTLDGRLWEGRTMALSRDGKTVALGTNYNTIRLWTVSTGKELFTDFRGHDAGVNRVIFSSDGKTLISGGDNRQTRLWDTTTWQQTRLLPGTARDLALTADGRWLATVPYDQTVRIWDFNAGKEVHKLSVPATTDPMRVTFLPSPSDRELVTLDFDGSESSKPRGRSHLVVWDAPTGRPLRRFSLSGLWAGSLALTPNGRSAAVGAQGGIQFYDLQSGEEQLVLPTDQAQLESLGFAPDGQTLVAGRADGQLALWERASGKVIIHLPKYGRFVGTVAVAPGGRLLASVEGWPSAIHLWDATTGAEVGCFRGLSGNITSLAFSPDGTQLVSGHRDSTILVWDLRPVARRLATLLKKPAAGELPALWDALAGEPGLAHRSLWRLAANPALAVPFLRARLRPATEADPVRVRRLIADLGSTQLAVRDKAARELGDLGQRGVPALRQALENNPTLEVRRRLEALRDDARVVRSSETLRVLRAMQALEHMGTKEATELLERMSKGAARAESTVQARAALERLAREIKK
jgi:RNA polymerase sigma factor (sigma-70 family)